MSNALSTFLTSNQQVNIFDQTVMNAYSNFAPDKTVTFNIRDPPWMKANIKDKMSYRKFLKKRKQ